MYTRIPHGRMRDRQTATAHQTATAKRRLRGRHSAADQRSSGAGTTTGTRTHGNQQKTMAQQQRRGGWEGV